ncbi:hypothetical protein KIN20_028965 [Parelaphostrongylus tenuis]|uniref:Uncharacterized protein n=1 Tax=Parelaphostrongylus tenuis TaxID=148309 RepID=A0AAD5R1S8_PARTN|nr:hypothetical protein KIN20_028965 [Parelaphostrongylus tenuis]
MRHFSTFGEDGRSLQPRSSVTHHSGESTFIAFAQEEGYTTSKIHSSSGMSFRQKVTSCDNEEDNLEESSGLVGVQVALEKPGPSTYRSDLEKTFAKVDDRGPCCPTDKSTQGARRRDVCHINEYSGSVCSNCKRRILAQPS